MHDFFSSPIWQFVGVVFALFAIVLSLIVFFKQRQRKRLDYDILSSTPLLSVREDIRGRVEILFDKQPVEEVQLFIVKLTNTGNIPITKHDFEEPVTLTFGVDARLLTAEIIETSPKSLRTSIQGIDNRVIVQQGLLNAGDSITIKTLSTGGDNLSVDGRIQGVKGNSKLNG